MAGPLDHRYTRYHARWHRERLPIFWWLRRRPYAKFISRELTSLAVAYTVVLLLVHVFALERGEDAYALLRGWLRHPALIALHAAVFLALLFHAVTWLNLAPKALALKLGGRRVSSRAVLAAHYGAWLLTSAGVAWVLLVAAKG